MPTLTAVQGTITTQAVDAIVNTGNDMRDTGGVSAAISRAGGPTIWQDRMRRFPRGLATGDAGWTTGGDLPAQWVIHTVGPVHHAGQRDRALLESCYRRALAVADGLGARTIAFPLIGAGASGWPLREAATAAVAAIAATATNVEQVRFVALGETAHWEIRRALARSVPVRILQGVRELHRRGYHRVRALPGVNASGTSWRVALTVAENLSRGNMYVHLDDYDRAVHYTTAGFTAFAGAEITVATSSEEVADLILAALPDLNPNADDPSYAVWFEDLMRLVERFDAPPVAYADYFDPSQGWEIGWGSGVFQPHPPA
jgi:O-acetyl-ADP-ribose deacetylase (regulator of RNase III)